MMELLNSPSAVASLIVILLSALAIPAGVMYALLKQIKGPIEEAQAAHDAPAQASSERRQRALARA